jgi:3-oxoacyl-[acyl-carrier protein] reductase
MVSEPDEYAPEEMRAGLASEFEREVTEDDVLDFARNSGDANPLHIDPEYASQTDFGRRIVHGAFQVGLASAMLGMRLPGRSVLLSNINARFPSPLYFPCRVKVTGVVTAWNVLSRVGHLKVVVIDAAAKIPTAEITMGFTLHRVVGSGVRETIAAAPPGGPSDRKAVLVTGASGGIGAEIVSLLAGHYLVLAASHRQPLDDRLKSSPFVRELRLDFSSPDLTGAVEESLGGGRLYGVVHAAWPGAPHGGLLQAPDEVVASQLDFGAYQTIRLARLLFSLAGEEGGRFVALGSIVGSQKPVVSLGAYVLGKAALETTVKLLAPEMARRGITVNAVCPSFVPTGINKHASEQRLKMETARVPLGRLCTPEDVAWSVRHLLSPEARFISGQIIGLSGGQL